MSEQITIRRASDEADVYGDPIPGVFSDHITWFGKFSPNNPSEASEVGRNKVIAGGAVYVRDLPVRPDLRPTDRAIVRGVEYEIDGEVNVWARSTSWAIHFVVKLAKEAR